MVSGGVAALKSVRPECEIREIAYSPRMTGEPVTGHHDPRRVGKSPVISGPGPGPGTDLIN